MTRTPAVQLVTFAPTPLPAERIARCVAFFERARRHGQRWQTEQAAKASEAELALTTANIPV